MDLKSQSFYNLIGNLIYLFSQWLLTVIATRVSGVEQAGILTLAMTVGNVFYFIGMYGGRGYQVSDSNEEYTTSDYIAVRLLTCSCSLILSIIVTVALGYKGEIVAVIISFTIYRLFEAISDTIFGDFQQKGKLEYLAISMTIKSVFTVIVFYLSLKYAKSLTLAMFLVAVVAFMVTLLVDYPNLQKQSDYKNGHFSILTTRGILIKSFGLFICSFLPTIVLAIPRVILEKCYGSELMGYYGNISTPTALITAIVPNILTVLMTLYKEKVQKGKNKDIIYIFAVSLIGTAILCAFCMMGVLILGNPVMKLIYTEKILPYVKYLYPLLISTSLYAVTMCANTVLICLKKNIEVIICSLIAVIITAFISFYFVNKYAIEGIVMALCISYGIQFILQCIFIFLWYFRKRNKRYIHQ